MQTVIVVVLLAMDFWNCRVCNPAPQLGAKSVSERLDAFRMLQDGH